MMYALQAMQAQMAAAAGGGAAGEATAAALGPQMAALQQLASLHQLASGPQGLARQQSGLPGGQLPPPMPLQQAATLAGTALAAMAAFSVAQAGVPLPFAPPESETMPPPPPPQ